MQSINRDRLAQDKVNSELEGVIESYELAFRMQTAVPKLMDFKDESPSTLDSLRHRRRTDRQLRPPVPDGPPLRRGGRAVHRARPRRLGPAQQPAQPPDRATAPAIDQPIAALLADLKQRDLLKDTLVVWGGEFGRTPHAQNADGRDHNAAGYTMWLAGGGVKGGLRYGATDEHGIRAVENKMHIHDLHATILHLLGLDHEQLTYRYSGRDFRLTDVHGNVAKEILA